MNITKQNKHHFFNTFSILSGYSFIFVPLSVFFKNFLHIWKDIWLSEKILYGYDLFLYILFTIFCSLQFAIIIYSIMTKFSDKKRYFSTSSLWILKTSTVWMLDIYGIYSIFMPKRLKNSNSILEYYISIKHTNIEKWRCTQVETSPDKKPYMNFAHW